MSFGEKQYRREPSEGAGELCCTAVALSILSRLHAPFIQGGVPVTVNKANEHNIPSHPFYS